MADTLPLPEPDTHCWDDDTGRDVWSYSPDLVRSIVAAAVQAEREACAVAAWSAGMDAHTKACGFLCDARNVGSLCAAAIRARKDTHV